MPRNMNMYLHTLGTASGAPSIERNVSASAVSFDGAKPWYLIDCGEGTQHRLLRSSLSAYHLEAVFITHLHGDHCYGLPGLIASMAMNGRTSPLTLVAPKAVIEFIHATIIHTQLGLNFELHYQALEEAPEFLEFERVRVENIALKHRVASVGFKFTEKQVPRKLKLDMLARDGIASGPHFNLLQRGQDVEYQGKYLKSDDYTYLSWRPRSMIVCGDNEKPALLAPHMDEVDLLCHEATFTAPDLHRVGFHTGHSDAKRVAHFAEQANVPALVLTHFSARYHGPAGVAKIEQEAKEQYRGPLFMAYDGLVLQLDTQGHCTVVNQGDELDE